MESWPARSRGLMSGILQGSWSIGFLLSSAAYGLLYDHIGWRGMLWIGILPALSLIYVRYFVKEPEVWLQNRRLQREQKREVRAPLLSIFKRGLLGNTLTACWWMASALFRSPSGAVRDPSPEICTCSGAGRDADRAGEPGLPGQRVLGLDGRSHRRRWSMSSAAIGIFMGTAYLLTDFT
jgi:MFS family permease